MIRLVTKLEVLWTQCSKLENTELKYKEMIHLLYRPILYNIYTSFHFFSKQTLGKEETWPTFPWSTLYEQKLTPCLTGKSLDLPRPDGHAWSTIVRRWWSGGPPWWGLLTPPFIINFLVKVITHHYYHHWDHSSTSIRVCWNYNIPWSSLKKEIRGRMFQKLKYTVLFIKVEYKRGFRILKQINEHSN